MQADEIHATVDTCSFGSILVAASRKGIRAVFLGDDADAVTQTFREQFPEAGMDRSDPKFTQWVAQILGFVEAPSGGLDVPLDVQGTVFQKRVWRALRDVPAGATASYAEIATRIGAPRAARAVAGACAANTIAIAIPCHRIVRADGSASGYRWGAARKRALLAREAAS